MNVLYLALESPHSLGVKKKIYSKIECLNKAGITTKGLYFSEAIRPDEKSDHPDIDWKHYEQSSLPSIFNRRIFWRFQGFYKARRFYRELDRVIRQKYNPDLIVLRYPGADLALLHFAKHHKVVFEHNTKEEYELLTSSNTFLFNYYYRSEKFVGPRILRRSAAIIGVTPEIVAYEKARAGKNIRSTVISNGFDVNSVSLRKQPAFDGKSVNILLLIGSGVANWYGIDRFIKSLAAYKGPADIKLYIGGRDFPEFRKLASESGIGSKVIFMGELSGNSLNAVFDQCHLALAPLAMHRINLEEAATLKVKEYISRGIPFILGYKEVDLVGRKDVEDFCVQFPNDESLIDINKIVEFVASSWKRPELQQQMRAFAEQHLDYSVKAAQLKDFLLSLEKQIK